jgi:cytochrome c
MKTTNTMIKGLVLVGAILASSSAMASADLYKKCAGCHGVHGERKAMGKSKVIASMGEDGVKTALHGYKDGTYGGAMKGLMKGQVARLSDAELDSLAKYIATLK